MRHQGLERHRIGFQAPTGVCLEPARIQVERIGGTGTPAVYNTISTRMRRPASNSVTGRSLSNVDRYAADAAALLDHQHRVAEHPRLNHRMPAGRPTADDDAIARMWIHGATRSQPFRRYATEVAPPDRRKTTVAGM